ncbi:MAG TPA: mannitol-1-phosphate 5-dehydrogenase, partial [Bacteroidales bacterium]|nr:mannitol-1-phosphate 5-dehydrogenase [Bacteroidales bacterium]
AAMLQSADILMKKYPGEFSEEDLTGHIDDLLIRFRNKALGDTVFRVGCDLMRKLGPEDRLAGAIKAAINYNLPYEKILDALICGFHFRATDENGELYPGDVEFSKHFDMGTDHLLKEICRFDEHRERQVFEEVRQLKRVRQGAIG